MDSCSHGSLKTSGNSRALVAKISPSGNVSAKNFLLNHLQPPATQNDYAEWIAQKILQ